MLRGSISFAEGVDGLAKLAPSDTKLPFESGESSAWADPMARAVVAHVGDQVLTAVLQYRHDTPANGGKPWRSGAVATLKPNNICRIELTEQDGAVDRLVPLFNIYVVHLPLLSVCFDDDVLKTDRRALHAGRRAKVCLACSRSASK